MIPIHSIGRITHTGIMQIQMQLPLIMQMAEAYSAVITAFAEGQPIGDDAGALVAAKLMHGHTSRTIEKETVVAETQFDGRRLLVLKAKGPGSTVGKPGKGNVVISSGRKRRRVLLIYMPPGLFLTTTPD